MGGGVVGTYVHTYEAPRRRPFQPDPPARSAQDTSGGPSATPIYDALCAEWVRAFKALPGDRHGEEDLGFTAFGSMPRGATSYGAYNSYSAGAHSARHSAVQQGHTTTATAIWQPSGRQHSTGMHHIPAALPPAPRRGL